MERLHDHIVNVDPLKRVIRAPEFGELYTRWLLELIRENDGVIYFAEKDGKVIGCSAGFIPSQSPHEVAGGVPSKYGRVQEMYVDERYRGEGIGKLLMEKLESYFREKQCDVSLVEVFASNKSAYEFYKICSYADRDINLMKKL